MAGSRIARTRRRAVCGEHPRFGQTASRRQQPVRPHSSSVDHLPGRHLGPRFPPETGAHTGTIGRGAAELIASDLRKVGIKVVLTRRATSRPIATGFDDGRSLVTCATRRRRLARQPEPPTLVLNEPSCYHFRALDSRVSAVRSSTMNVGGNNRPLFPHLSVAAW